MCKGGRERQKKRDIEREIEGEEKEREVETGSISIIRSEGENLPWSSE